MTPCTLVNISGNRASFPVRGKYLAVFERVQAAVGPTQWVRGGLSFGVRRPTCASDQSLSLTAALAHGCTQPVQRDSLVFVLSFQKHLLLSSSGQTYSSTYAL